MYTIVVFDRHGNTDETFDTNHEREGREVLRDIRDTRPGVCAILCDMSDGGRIIAEIQ